ncbi:receptor-like protein 2 [Pyrus ussuriensis x Pyrus communis]|uniref:Receptor-like protein 2 n=1 Tax=Pyrus ussuriensis x Pyrus communis TaxID=2448454 RepID=A0A5N5GL74_9ROSA|nr:receptor-like protein 2 [Pyrus ussuriensis x Pyrus communis]KAB2623854.1 receptor-like protein 2 [Pyrus ussuriensis x Pyrus communis]
MSLGFLLIFLFSSILSTTNIHACNQADHISLQAFSSLVDCCRWNGITCNQEGRVIHLLLPSKRLKGGMFVSSLQNLTHLTDLNLSHNSLHGALETKFFSSLNCLEMLDLSYNLFSGEIPFSIPPKSIRTIDFGNIFRGFGGCSKLQILRAGHNSLSGSLPEDIYNATKLEELALPLNSLNGAISERIANLTHLTFLDLFINNLSGVIPLNFGKLSKLKFMNLDFNSLRGNLPPSLMNCTNLVELHLGSNYLEGDLTKLNFSKISHLSKLDLSIRLSVNPYLKGQVHPEILSLKSLSFLSLSRVWLTNITGAMKILMRCQSLQTLLISSSFD